MWQWIILVMLIIEYFLWYAWLIEDGFFEQPGFKPTIVSGLEYTYYRIYYSIKVWKRKGLTNGTR